jgi:hypothetical protein
MFRTKIIGIIRLFRLELPFAAGVTVLVSGVSRSPILSFVLLFGLPGPFGHRTGDTAGNSRLLDQKY